MLECWEACVEGRRLTAFLWTPIFNSNRRLNKEISLTVGFLVRRLLDATWVILWNSEVLGLLWGRLEALNTIGLGQGSIRELVELSQWYIRTLLFLKLRLVLVIDCLG